MQSYTECWDPEIGYYPCWATQAHSAAYNAAGQITTWKEGTETSYNGFTRSYDPARGWLTSLTAGAYLDLSYTYNDNGRVSTVTDLVNSAFRTSTYQYDNLNRLTQATAQSNQSVTQWQLSWTYDEFGNRLTQTPLGGTPYTPPTSNLSYSSATNRISGYSYDNNGNLLSVSGTTLTYDIFDRVTQAVKGSNTYQYAYDAFGRRVAVTSNGSTTVHFYDIRGRLLGWDANPNTHQVYFAGQRVGQWTDRLGSIRAGSVGSSHYYPYGEEITGTGNNRYKFAETFRDSDTGLDYAKARYFSSSMGRFLSADPYPVGRSAILPQTWNLFTYVTGDPVNRADPTGLGDEGVPGVPPGPGYPGGSPSYPCNGPLIVVDPSCQDPSTSGSGNEGGENYALDQAWKKLQGSAVDAELDNALLNPSQACRDLLAVFDIYDTSNLLYWAHHADIRVGPGSPDPAYVLFPVGSEPYNELKKTSIVTVGLLWPFLVPTDAVMVAGGFSLGTNLMYFSPDSVNRSIKSARDAASLIGHETIHNVTGLSDDALATKLGWSGNGSSSTFWQKEFNNACFPK